MKIDLNESLEKLYFKDQTEVSSKHKLKEATSREDKKKRFCDWHGFDYNGVGYALIGETYSIKDDIKKLGGVWNQELRRWVCPKDISKEINRPVIKVEADKFYHKDRNAIWDYRNLNIMAIENIAKTFTQQDAEWKAKAGTKEEAESTSEYVGTENNRITVNLNYIKFKGFTQGGFYIYDMEDTNGNRLVWYGSNDYRDSLNQVVAITGTVTRHTEYRGISYTQLSRCKLHYSQQEIPTPKKSSSAAVEIPDDFFESLNLKKNSVKN